MVDDGRDGGAASTAGSNRDEFSPNIAESLCTVWSDVNDGELRSASLDIRDVDASHGTWNKYFVVHDESIRVMIFAKMATEP